MSYKIEINRDGYDALTYYDVSDWVTNLSEIPYITRNNDYTIVSDYVKLNLSQAYPKGNIFKLNDSVLIWSGSQLLYNGIIKGKNTLYDDLKYEYVVNNSLIESFDLKNIQFTYDEMNDYLTPYKQTKTIYAKVPAYGNDRWVQAHDLIYAIFDKIGITLDTTYVYYHLMNVRGFQYSVTTLNPPYLTHSDIDLLIGTDTLFFWIPMLYGINQVGMHQYGVIQNSETLMENVPTLYEVLVKLCSLLGIVFIPKTSTSYYIVSRYDDVPTRNNNYEEHYEQNYIAPKYKNFNMTYETLSAGSLTAPPNDPNRLYVWYPFLPNAAGFPFWLAGSYTSYTKNFSTDWYDTGGSKIEWFSHFIPFEILPDFTGYSNTLRMIMPRVDVQNNINVNLFKYYAGNCTEEIYENLIDTGFYSELIENYIDINTLNGRNPFSKIKLRTYTV